MIWINLPRRCIAIKLQIPKTQTIMKTFDSNKRLKRWTIFDFSMIICLNTSAQIAAFKR